MDQLFQCKRKAKTIRQLEKNIVVNLHDLGLVNIFLDTTSKA